MRKLHKIRSIIFQQDGARAHFSTDVRQYLDNHFPNRWIGRGAPIRWAPRSPDLTPLDFFLWGHVKSNIYKNLTELKRRINTEIKSISKETLSDVFSNIVKKWIYASQLMVIILNICCKPQYMK